MVSVTAAAAWLCVVLVGATMGRPATAQEALTEGKAEYVATSAAARASAVWLRAPAGLLWVPCLSDRARGHMVPGTRATGGSVLLLCVIVELPCVRYLAAPRGAARHIARAGLWHALRAGVLSVAVVH